MSLSKKRQIFEHFLENSRVACVNLSFGREIFAEYSTDDYYQWCRSLSRSRPAYGAVWSRIRLRRIEIRPRWRYRTRFAIHGQVERTANVEILGSRRMECAQVRQHHLLRPAETFFFLLPRGHSCCLYMYVRRNLWTKRTFQIEETLGNSGTSFLIC